MKMSPGVLLTSVIAVLCVSSVRTANEGEAPSKGATGSASQKDICILYTFRWSYSWPDGYIFTINMTLAASLDRRLLKYKRQDHVAAVQSIAQIHDFVKQYRMIELVLEKLFQVWTERQLIYTSTACTN